MMFPDNLEHFSSDSVISAEVVRQCCTMAPIGTRSTVSFQHAEDVRRSDKDGEKVGARCMHCNFASASLQNDLHRAGIADSGIYICTHLRIMLLACWLFCS